MVFRVSIFWDCVYDDFDFRTRLAPTDGIIHQGHPYIFFVSSHVTFVVMDFSHPERVFLHALNRCPVAVSEFLVLVRQIDRFGWSLRDDYFFSGRYLLL